MYYLSPKHPHTHPLTSNTPPKHKPQTLTSNTLPKHKSTPQTQYRIDFPAMLNSFYYQKNLLDLLAFAFHK
jgi:hypothetical protein